MKRLLILLVSVLVFIGVLMASKAPFRRRRLEHNFSFVELHMSESAVARVLGESGTIQSCSATFARQCDHEAVYYLDSANYFAVAFDKQGYAVGKLQSY